MSDILRLGKSPDFWNTERDKDDLLLSLKVTLEKFSRNFWYVPLRFGRKVILTILYALR